MGNVNINVVSPWLILILGTTNRPAFRDPMSAWLNYSKMVSIDKPKVFSYDLFWIFIGPCKNNLKPEPILVVHL